MTTSDFIQFNRQMNSIEPEGESVRRHFELGSGKFDLLLLFKTTIII